MDQFTRNLERAHKYRYSHFQSYVAQNQKNKLIEIYNSSVAKIWVFPVISSLASLYALRNNNSNVFSKTFVLTGALVGVCFIYNHYINEILEKKLNNINRFFPNPVQLQEEYARDLEIFQRLGKN